MMAWTARPQEERALLNPAFCSTLLWRAAQARTATGTRLISLEEAFLILPLVLPSSTRELLPSTVRTSLPVWLDANPLEQRFLVNRSRSLITYTRAALLFAATRKFITIEAGLLSASPHWAKLVRGFDRKVSAEVKQCGAKAEFVSKWFASAGDSATVLAVLGVRP